MICIKCAKETPDTEMYCRHCGTRLDFTFDQITSKLGQDIQTEKEEETESFFRWIMLILLFVFFSGWMFHKLWVNTPSPTISPAYKPAVEVAPKYPELPSTVVIPE